MKQNTNENAANRTSYVGHVYTIGEKAYKKQVLDSLPTEWRELHTKGYIHIHDLDAYGLTYNCLTFNLVPNFPYNKFKNYSDQRKIVRLFDFLKELFTKMGNEQSGGMAFANFDNEMAEVITNLNIKIDETNLSLIKDAIGELILWCNDNHTRMGQTSYYVTFNIGLADSDLARTINSYLLDEFYTAGDLIYKPNIVFKVHAGHNRYADDPNHYLLKKALLCTAKKMIPTYLLCDSLPNKNYDPYRLAIMGCRTRVVTDVYGCEGSIGRGNIDNISINLPRLALEIVEKWPGINIDERVRKFKKRWNEVATITKDILLDRYYKTCQREADDFPTNSEYKLWCEDFTKVKSLEEVFKHGTLSIGFIGLSEAVEVLTGAKYYSSADNYVIALGIVKHMRDFCDFLRYDYNLNFSLLATSGELISGRFIDIDKEIFKPSVDIFTKGYYTNSFHIDVDSGLPAYKKIQMEGLFHEACNGGCITYVELGEAPLGNDEGLLEYIEIAIKSGTHYLGFNFPKDICDECGASGVFDECPICHGRQITRIRRVSGYLEVLEGFTKGKKAEEKNRRKNG